MAAGSAIFTARLRASKLPVFQRASANSWFNNHDGIERPQLNQNQGGGTFGGRLIRDKLFFYANYEAYRLNQKSTANRLLLTDT